MKAKDLYKRLDDDFIKPGLTDDWFQYMPELGEYICDSFKEKNMGLVCDFAETINEVYTAVFPSEGVFKKLINSTENAMLFVHHASIWDLRKSPVGFYNMNASLLEKLREKRISIYCLHVPLDNFSDYSTSKSLADALGLEIVKPFVKYRGSLSGVIGKTKCKTIEELQKVYSDTVGHETKLYKYGDSVIKDNNVGVCAGGGNNVFVVEELLENDIKVLITGVSVKNDHSAETHALEEKNKINVIGGTHYSTEKFACIAMCKYFTGLGLKAEFIKDSPCMEDI